MIDQPFFGLASLIPSHRPYSHNAKLVHPRRVLSNLELGFKSLNHALLLHDTIIYSHPPLRPWLIYYISRPLIGIWEPLAIVPASLSTKGVHASHGHSNGSTRGSSDGPEANVLSLTNILDHFPTIASQVQPILDEIVVEARRELDKPLPPLPSRPVSRATINSFGPGSASELHPDEAVLRERLETAVTAALGVFQDLDKQQLASIRELAKELDLDRLVERHVIEQLHPWLFRQVSAARAGDDTELQSCIRAIADVDIMQLGLAAAGEAAAADKVQLQLLARISKAVEVMARMQKAQSPHEMLAILLDTQKTLTSENAVEQAEAGSEKQSEKCSLTVNADTLISLLLLTVVRAPVTELRARLSYMKHFCFVQDVERGEMGYALSTFELLLSYIVRASDTLRQCSRRNRRLWHAVRRGDLSRLRVIFEADSLNEMDGSNNDMDSPVDCLDTDALPALRLDPDDSALSADELDSSSLDCPSLDSLAVESSGRGFRDASVPLDACTIVSQDSSEGPNGLSHIDEYLPEDSGAQSLPSKGDTVTRAMAVSAQVDERNPSATGVDADQLAFSEDPGAASVYSRSNGSGFVPLDDEPPVASITERAPPIPSGLSHVFPFQRQISHESNPRSDGSKQSALLSALPRSGQGLDGAPSPRPRTSVSDQTEAPVSPVLASTLPSPRLPSTPPHMYPTSGLPLDLRSPYSRLPPSPIPRQNRPLLSSTTSHDSFVSGSQRKRVSMERRSISSASEASNWSSLHSLDSRGSLSGTDLSLATLAHARTSAGQSVLMLAVQHGQLDVVTYLLALPNCFPLAFVLADGTNDGTTLLSAAVRAGFTDIADLLLTFLTRDCPAVTVRTYLARQDSSGRCVAHYLFGQPQLIARLGALLPWTLRDKNGQTPLFALCRCYDHEQYVVMVNEALSMVEQLGFDVEHIEALDAERQLTPAEQDKVTTSVNPTTAVKSLPGIIKASSAELREDPLIRRLNLDDHIDSRGNTLLHIVNHVPLVRRLLACRVDVNAANERLFTPLMLASKYGRVEQVCVLLADARVDLLARDFRSLTATELAKDDDVRNCIDDLLLFQTRPTSDGRRSSVVRSAFVDDGSVRLMVKSSSRAGVDRVYITTCRRSLADFETLTSLLALEHPASWVPTVAATLSPYLIPSKPSRAVLHDLQFRLDRQLKLLLQHATFAAHELVWEFHLVPDLDARQLAERTRKKAEARAERVRDEVQPVLDTGEVELFIAHARDSLKEIADATGLILFRLSRLGVTFVDQHEAMTLLCTAVGTVADLPRPHKTAFERYAKTLRQAEAAPLLVLQHELFASAAALAAFQTVFARPDSLVASMRACRRAVERHSQVMRRPDRWPMGLLSESRHKMQREAAIRAQKARLELDSLGRELRYTHQTVAGELASWHTSRTADGRAALRDYAAKTLVIERARLDGMRRALEAVQKT